jgi:hypothetical protein
MNVIKNISHTTLFASGFVAIGCHFLNSPKLEKVKTLSIVIGLGAAMVYGYLDTASQSSPLVSRANPTRVNTTQTDLGVAPIEGTKTQFKVPNGAAACTVLAAEDLISMLKRTHQTSYDIDQILDRGGARYTALSRELDEFKEAGQVSFSWDQVYNSARLVYHDRPHSGFQKELISACDKRGIPEVLNIPLSNSHEGSCAAYLRAIQKIESEVTRTNKPQGGILIMSPETYSLCITPGERGKMRYRLFDSHGSFFLPNAAIFEFSTADELARFLNEKKQFLPEANRDYNTCGLYLCKLREGS